METVKPGTGKAIPPEHARLYDMYIFKLIGRIADIVREYQSDHCYTGYVAFSESNLHSHFRQTEGFFLEFNYGGGPSALWTLWGTYVISSYSPTMWEEKKEEMLKRLGAKPYFDFAGQGESCLAEEVYALHEVDGAALPEPKELAEAAFAHSHAVYRAWQQLRDESDFGISTE